MRRNSRAIFLLGSLPLLAKGEQKWLRLESEHFELYSSAGERTARETLRNFEQVRGFFREAIPNATPDSKVYLVEFSSEKEYTPYRMNDFAIAYYRAGADRDYIVMGRPGPDAFPVAVHEYAHLVVRHLGFNFPPWLNEGLAELYSTLKPQGDRILIGTPIAGRLQAMSHERWVELQTIVEADHDSPYYNEKARAGHLYNEGWALVHMLALTKEYRPKFPQVLAALADGGESQEALERVYGKPLWQIDKELQAYIHSSYFNGALVSAKLDKSKDSTPVESAKDYDVNLVLTQLTEGRGKESETGARYTKLTQDQPERPEAWSALGYIEWRQGHLDESRANFAKAFEKGDRAPRFLWDYGRLEEGADPQRASDILRVLLESQPDRIDIRLELAQIALQKRRAGEALMLLREIKKVNAADAPRLFALSAYAEIGMKATDAAKTSVAQLEKYAKSERDRSDLERLKSYLASADERALATPVTREAVRPEADLEEEPPPTSETTLRRTPQLADRSSPVPKQLPTESGKFVELQCLGDHANFVVDTGSAKKRFRIDDPEKIVIVGVPGGKLDLQCGPQTPAAVRVEYAKSGAEEIDGEIRVIWFEK